MNTKRILGFFPLLLLITIQSYPQTTPELSVDSGIWNLDKSKFQRLQITSDTFLSISNGVENEFYELRVLHGNNDFRLTINNSTYLIEKGTNDEMFLSIIKATKRNNGVFLSVKKKILSNPKDFLSRLSNSALSDSFYASHPNGFNEFDIIPANDGTGDYEMVFDAREKIKYVRFRDKNDLQSKINAEQDLLIWQNASYPCFIKEGGFYYVYALILATQKIMCKKASSIEGLIDATPFQILTGGYSDFSVKKNPKGGYIAGGHKDGIAKVFTSNSLEDGWIVAKENMFIDSLGDNYPGYDSHHQADGVIFFKANRLFYMANMFKTLDIHGNNMDGNPQVSHNMIWELDENYNIIRNPIEIIHQQSATWHSDFNPNAFCYNPVFIENNGNEEIFYSLSSETTGLLGKIDVSRIDTPKFVPKNWLMGVKAGNEKDLSTNIPHRTLGAINNSTNGIEATETNSGLYNYFSKNILLKFELSLKFIPKQFPEADSAAVIYHMQSEGNTNWWTIYINSIGKVFLKMSAYPTTEIDLRVQATLNQECELTIKRDHDGKMGIVFCNGIRITSEMQPFNKMSFYSLFNKWSPVSPPSEQFIGIIKTGELVPF